MSWRGFLHRKYWDRSRSEEMESHIAFEIEENLSRGVNETEARRLAYIKFGNPQKMREEIWRMNSFSWLASTLRDFRYAGRTLLRNRGYAILAILTLGLGIGANTAVFTVINGVLLRPLPYADESRILHIDQSVPKLGTDPIGLSVQEFGDYRSQSDVFSAIAEYHAMTFTLLGTKDPKRVVTGVVSANFFDVFGVKPILGRSFVESDEMPGATPVLILSNHLWMREFGGDPAVIGRVFKLNDRTHTVVGVLPPLPDYPDNDEVFMPVSSCPFRMAPRTIQDRDARMVSAYARLKPGVSIERARTELSGITGRMVSAWPKSYAGWTGFTALATPIKDELTHAARPTFLALLGASSLVLLLACVNLANLTLSRLLRRSGEVAIRMATGASVWRIVRQLMVESLLVALAGACIGIAVAAAGTKLLVAYAARLTPLAGDIRFDGRVLLFSIGSALLSGLLFTAIPGIIASRTPLTALGDSGERAAGSAGGTRIRTALVTLQVIFSFVLLMCAGLMLRSLYNLLSVDPGFKSAQVLSVQLNLNWTKYQQNADTLNFHRQLLARTEALPGVEAASVSWKAPLNPISATINGRVEIDGQAQPQGTAAPLVDFETASLDYFRVLDIPIVSGRTFTEADSEKAMRTVIVNARMARHFWPGLDPIGHRVRAVGSEDWLAVVGVIGDVHQDGLNKDPTDTLYLPLAQNPIKNAHLLVRTRGNPLTLANQVAAIVHGIDPEQPITRVQTLDQMRSDQLGTPRVTALLLGLFAAVALFITVVGISGSLALAVAQRSREIGLRIALGATRPIILGEVLRRGMAPVLIGLGLGIAASLFADRALAQLIFGLTPNDPATFAAIAALFAAVGLISCLIPARRAMLIDPVESLRTQ
jgi:predicted permease